MRALPDSFWAYIDRLLDEGVVAWVVAIELRSGLAFYLTPNREPIQHAGLTWLPFALKFGRTDDSGSGDLPSSTMTLSNVGRLAMPYLEGDSWDQATVMRRLVWLAEPELETGLVVEHVVQGATATHESVTLALGQPNYFERPFPPGRFLRSAGFAGIPRPQQ